MQLNLGGPLDRLAALACTALGAPYATIGIINGDTTEFRTTVGLDLPSLPASRTVTHAMVALGSDAEFIINDALTSVRCASHPLVTGAPHARFFAGVTITSPSGQVVGSLGVFDVEPRPNPPREQMDILRALAKLAGDMVDQAELVRAQAERANLLRLAEEMAGVGRWRYDIVTGRISWSEEVYRIHGVSPDSFEPTLETALDFYHPDDRPIVEAAVARVLADGVDYRHVSRLQRADGEERLVEARTGIERGPDGAVLALFGVFQDVTERESSRRSLAASEKAYRAIAERTGDIIAVFSLNGVFSYLSPAMETILGWSPEELIGTRTWELIHPDDHKAVRDAYKVMLAAGPDGERVQLRYRGRKKGGDWAWLEAQPTLLWDDDGGVVAIQDNIRDVTRTQRLEDELIEARIKAEEAVRAKSEFLANMSHELRTPLTAVIGFAGLLGESEGLGEADRRHVGRIAVASDSLLNVINDILDYSKLEAGRVDLDPMPFDPRRIAEGAAALLEEQAGSKGVVLSVEVGSKVPASVMADEGRLRQVLLNFLSNAVKFTARGVVRVRLDWADDVLRAEVQDSGIGISEDAMNRLFDRFVQADASTTRKFGGTGLGLSICQKLIQLMGGRIGAVSKPGEGATFWFEAPAPQADAVSVSRDIAPTTLGSMRILVADDAAANRELVSIMLTAMGLSVETVENGAEAVEAVGREAFDAVLMDVHMPVMDGLEATRAIRAMATPASRTPIIALTANVQPDQIAACRAAGMDAHVGKPIQPAELFGALAAPGEDPLPLSARSA